MSQFTLSLILQLVGLALSVLNKALRLIGSIADIVDDGVINGSYERPIWYERLISILEVLTSTSTELRSCTEQIVNPISKENAHD